MTPPSPLHPARLICFLLLTLPFTRLGVASNSITGEGLVALAESLKINPVLSHIYIWGNKFDEATSVVCLFLSVFFILCAEVIEAC